MAKYSEKTLRNRAKEIDYYVTKGYQKYIFEVQGFVRDENGDKVVGYDLIRPNGYSLDAPYESEFRHDHTLTLDELESYLQKLYEERGLPWQD